MSYIMPSQRGFDHPHQDLANLSSMHNQNSRMSVSSPPFDEYANPPHPSYPTSPLSAPSLQNGQQTSPHPEFTSRDLPKVGQTRCYWVLLSSELHFIYLDPVLQSHLGEQATSLVGKPLISFMHPDEQASAKHDLGSVLESRTLHGSVTRVRFSRLSRVRRQLGYQGPPPAWPDANKISIDDNYMAVDLVINWAAEGIVLCFIHAAVDLTEADNDEAAKTGWTNWCGTPSMGRDQMQLLFQRLQDCIIPHGGLSRVFQILSNQDRGMLLSWPPDAEGRTGRDFAKLIENVQIGSGTPGASDAKTSCTRRWKAEQNMPGGVGPVESICIPHGTIIFACHKVNEPSRTPGSAATTIQQLGYSTNNYGGPPSQHYYDQNNQYVLPPLPPSSAYNTYNTTQPHHPSATSYSSHNWPSGGEPASPHHYAQWNTQNPTHSMPTSVSNLRSGSYSSHQQAAAPWPSGSPNSSSAYVESGNGLQPNFSRSMSPQFGYAEAPEAPSAAPDVVPPPRRRVSPGATREQYATGGRSAGNRPVGILSCSSCQATHSPEWRKGPSGKKELCNACGLRYARSRAKKEGHNISSPRRRKDKSSKQGSGTPPSASGLRRTYDGSPLLSTTTSDAGSGSGSPVYPAHHSFDGLTPSPSPPAGNMNFVHYHPQHHHPQHQHHPHHHSHHHGGGHHVGDSRQPPYGSASAGGSASFYSVPSPLSNPPVLHGMHGQQQQQRQTAPGSSGSSSRAEHVSHHHSYGTDRISSPLVSPSPLTTSMPPPSFERDRDRDRELPPVSLPVDARSSSVRSILLTE